MTAPTHAGVVGEVARFGATGLVATGVHAAVAASYLAAAGPGAHSLAANTAGYLAAVACSFFGNALWVFRRDERLSAALPRFVAVSLTCYVVVAALAALGDRMGAAPLAVLALVVLTVPPASFLANKLWVFRQRGPGLAADRATQPEI